MTLGINNTQKLIYSDIPIFILKSTHYNYSLILSGKHKNFNDTFSLIHDLKGVHKKT